MPRSVAAKPQFDADVAAILARLRRARVIYSDETGVRIDGSGHWNWVFQNAEVVIHVVRRSRGAGRGGRGAAAHRPALWVSDLYGAQQGHADALAGLSRPPVARLPSMPSTLATRCSPRA